MKGSASLKTLYILFAFLLICFYSALPAIDSSATYYTTASSTSKMIEKENFVSEYGLNFFSVKAESAFFSEECDLDKLLKRYKARIEFTETVDGITSYYCMSKILPIGKKINGRQINLHVAIAPYGYSIGFPIIPGGY